VCKFTAQAVCCSRPNKLSAGVGLIPPDAPEKPLPMAQNRPKRGWHASRKDLGERDETGSPTNPII
jgi:hypothetical protein